MPTVQQLDIKADMGPQEAVDACAALAADMAGGAGTQIEFDAGSPSIFAMQIALSCKRSLQQNDRFSGFGPNAQRFLGEFLKIETPFKVAQ